MSESNVVTPPNSFTIAILEAALAERDKRIAELEALVEEMKCCQNCGNHLFASSFSGGGNESTMHRCKCWYKVEDGCSDSSKWIPPFPFVKEADDE